MRRGFLAATVLTAALFAVSCNSNRARIRGTVEGAENLTAYLAQAGEEPQDSTVADAAGRFEFRVELPAGEPTLYNIRIGGQNFTVLPSAGERVMLSARLGEWEYAVSGSRESELIREVNNIMQGGLVAMDSLARSMVGEQDTVTKRAYVREYINTKRAQIRFIVENSSSLAAIYALYQRLPGDATLFNGEGDIVYYRMVADSVAMRYPTSPYLKTLNDLIVRVDNRQALMHRLNESLAHPLSHPAIELKDMFGRVQTLDNNMGKVTLVVFSSMLAAESPTYNAELKQLYDEFAQRGLAIYQVSLDADRTLWLNAVQEQRIPWTSVIDTRGADAPSVRMYNVTTLPTLFLLDKEGNILYKNLSFDDLLSRLNKML